MQNPLALGNDAEPTEAEVQDLYLRMMQQADAYTDALVYGGIASPPAPLRLAV